MERIVLAVHILTEPEYASSTWCNKIIQGLTTEAKNKKIDYYFQTKDFVSTSEDMIALIGNSSVWIQNTLNKIQPGHSAHIILISNTPYKSFIINICTDFSKSMLDIISYLKNDCKKKNIALYGINMSSSTDVQKLQGFTSAEHIYYNNCDLLLCFNEFYKNIDLYDAVICANDYAAISLLQNLKQIAPSQVKRLFIISFSNLYITQIYKPSITSVSLNYYEYGKIAINLYRMILKNPEILTGTLNVKSIIIPRETTRNIPFSSTNYESQFENSENMDFYKDKEIFDLLTLEKLFLTMNNIDINIIRLLSNGLSYEQISQELFISVNGIKYRLNKLLNTCNIKDRKELLNIYKKYFSD